jgi:hypothetical protein
VGPARLPGPGTAGYAAAGHCRTCGLRSEMTDGDDLLQRRTCRLYAADFVESAPDSGIRISADARPGAWPLNGLRYLPDGGGSGWYIWSGETLSPDPDFFEEHRVSDISALLPAILPYVGLPPGWRFLLAEDHEDVWYDAALLPG